MAEHQPDTEYTQIQNPQPADLLLDNYLQAKTTDKVQVVRGTVKYPLNAEEYFSRMAFDNMDEKRGTITVANVFTTLDFGLIVKYVEITVPVASASAAYVNFNGPGSNAGNTNGNLEIRVGETRGYFIPTRYVNVGNDGAGTATYRVTVGW